MKIGFTTLGCPDWSWDKIVAEAARIGYDGIELRGIEGEMYLPNAAPFLPENMKETMASIQQAGLEIICLGSSCSFHNPDNMDRAIAEGKAYIDLARRMGVPYIRVFGDFIPDEAKRMETIAQVAHGVNTLGEYAEDQGVCVLLESHGDFSAPSHLLAVMEQTSSAAVGVLWDVAHTYKYGAGASMRESFNKLQKYIKHVHIKDSRGRGKEEEHCLVGAGDVPIRETIAVLLENGYQGWLSFEWEKKWIPELEEPEVAFPAFIDYFRRLNLLPSFSEDHWRSWSPREEVAPKFTKYQAGDEVHLLIHGNGDLSSHGSWWCEAQGIQGGMTYLLQAEYWPEGVGQETVSINMIATWSNQSGEWLRRDYIDEYSKKDDGWVELSKTVKAPSGSHAVKIELELRWSDVGKVSWRKSSISLTKPIRPKKVKLATTYINVNSGTRHDLANNLQEILDSIEQAGKDEPDLICLPETMYGRRSGKPLSEIAQPIPGELTAIICDKAREIRSYIVFNMYELEGRAIYNTSILIDRNGDIVGKYRKTHLPLFEAQSGVMPGDTYPVFETDFGKVGIMICWDQWFPEAARALRLQGAEIICLPTAGDAGVKSTVRAMENGVYLVIAGINGTNPSRIISPEGKILGEISKENSGVLCTEVDLNQKYYVNWYSIGPCEGEPRSIDIKERRPDTYGLLGQ